jgi:FkbM family methyltransferase
MAIVNSIRTWFRAHPQVGDRLKPIVRRCGYITPVQRELARHFRRWPAATAIQIGAHDGVTHDPFREYLIHPGWQSVVVEPNPSVFKLLRRNYEPYPSVHPVNAAVSYSAKQLTLWTFDEAYLKTRLDGLVLSTLVSFSRENMARFVSANDEALNHLHSFTIDCATVEELAEQRNLSRVDALFVDVEGYENDILPHVQYAKLGIRAVVFENHLLPDHGEIIKSLLTSQGFSCVDVEADTIATR